MDLMNAKRILAAALAPTLLLAACSTPEQEDDTLNVLASFYPLEYLVQEIGQDRVTVSSLTPQGGEPHDLELAPAQTKDISGADLVVYQSGFQSAVDKAVEARTPEHVFDAGVYATLALTEDDGHDHSADDGHDHETDPHFWLDPKLYAQAAQDLAGELSEVDPEGAEQYQANAQSIVDKLTVLDQQYSTELATCQHDTVVVTHAAFGYLAHEYNFNQLAISGIDPEAEPSPAQIRNVRSQVEELGLKTIFFETLVSPKVAETLAADLGIDTGLLDPIEGLVNTEETYFSIMENNLTQLKTGLGCA
nr:metal ABC transporter substrate-binding protein [Jonesia quinghaiensis]